MHTKEENMKEFGPFLDAVRTGSTGRKKTRGKEESKDFREGKYEKMPISVSHQKKEVKKQAEEQSSFMSKIWSFLPQIRKLS